LDQNENKTLMLDNQKFALILGHPGHELRVHRFVERCKSRVYILTDGSGSTGSSRLATTLGILQDAGADQSTFMGRFTDHEFYNIILKGELNKLDAAVEEISKDLMKNGITAVAGDALEGFNPTHDVCRYMINAISRRINARNFDFALEGHPLACPTQLKDQAIWIDLSQADFERKMAAAQLYSEIKLDVEKAIGEYGTEIFRKECLRPVLDSRQIKNWQEEIPFYESYGMKKVKIGQYQDVISFDKHVRPIAEHMLNLR